MVALSHALTTDLDVLLASSDTTEADVSAASVTIPAGELMIGFAVSAVDDLLDDGDMSVNINGVSPIGNASALITVIDDEESILSIAVDPTQISENGGNGIGTASIDFALETDLVVMLSSSNVDEATVPATVTIVAGQLTAGFAITGVDDNVDDGDQVVSITGISVKGDDSASLAVQDDDTAVLSLTLQDAAISENGGTTTGNAFITHPLPSDLVIALSTSDTDELTVPNSVTIEAGKTSAAFTATAVDENIVDGDAGVTVNANSAIGDASDSVVVQR